MRKDRFIAGLICIAVAVWIFLTDTADDTVAPAIAIAVLGITMVAISKKRWSIAFSHQYFA